MTLLTQASASMTVPDQSASIWGEITAGEIALLIVGVIFTIGLVITFFWITFRASREKN